MNAAARIAPARPEPAALAALFVDAWQGVPFQWDGRSRAGVDCWGLVLRFHETVHGLTLPDWARRGEARAWIAETIAEQSREHWRALAAPADCCIVKARAHVGIYWRGGVLHATNGRGVVWERWADFAVQYPGAEFGEFVP